MWFLCIIIDVSVDTCDWVIYRFPGQQSGSNPPSQGQGGNFDDGDDDLYS